MTEEEKKQTPREWLDLVLETMLADASIDAVAKTLGKPREDVERFLRHNVKIVREELARLYEDAEWLDGLTKRVRRDSLGFLL